MDANRCDYNLGTLTVRAINVQNIDHVGWGYLILRALFLRSIMDQEGEHGTTAESFSAEYKREAVAMLDAPGVTVS